MLQSSAVSRPVLPQTVLPELGEQSTAASRPYHSVTCLDQACQRSKLMGHVQVCGCLGTDERERVQSEGGFGRILRDSIKCRGTGDNHMCQPLQVIDVHCCKWPINSRYLYYTNGMSNLSVYETIYGFPSL